MPKTTDKKKPFVHALEDACRAVPDTNPRAAAALRTILNTTLLAVRSLDDGGPAVRELESIGAAASASAKRLRRSRKADTPAARKRAEERSDFLRGLRRTLSSWRCPPPSGARKARPTLREVAGQLARALEQDQVLSLAEEAGVILPTTADMVDHIMREWSRHTEAYGEYYLGDSGSQQMIIDAFRGVGFPKRVADKLYDFAHRRKPHHHS